MILVPLSTRLHVLRAVRTPGLPGLHIEGLASDRTRTTADRVRAGLHNAGFALPTGRIDVTIDPAAERGGADLALAIGILLADPAHEHVRSPGLVAWGGVRLDGILTDPGPPPIPDLPPGAWVGRFWQPDDRVPDPDEDAVVSLVDVHDIHEAWRSLIGFLDLERELHAVASKSP